MWKFEFPYIRENCGKTLRGKAHGNELCKVQIRKKNTCFFMHEKRKTSLWVKQKQLLMLKLWSSVDKCSCILGSYPLGHPEQLQLPSASWSSVEEGEGGHPINCNLYSPSPGWFGEFLSSQRLKLSPPTWQSRIGEPGRGIGRWCLHFCLYLKGTWCPAWGTIWSTSWDWARGGALKEEGASVPNARCSQHPTRGKFFDLTKPQFPHRWNNDNSPLTAFTQIEWRSPWVHLAIVLNKIRNTEERLLNFEKHSPKLMHHSWSIILSFQFLL